MVSTSQQNANQRNREQANKTWLNQFAESARQREEEEEASTEGAGGRKGP